MNEKLHIVMFSFNRAMQLDATLNSIYEHIKGVEISTSILYHYSPSHRDSYAKLIEEWTERYGVVFHLRLEGRSFWQEVFPLFCKYYRNLPRYLRYRAAKDSTYQFKKQLENIIASSNAELTMLNPDDTIFYRTTTIPTEVIEVIKENPVSASYRMYVGRNQDDCPKNLKEYKGMLKWNYGDPSMYRHWAYPFSNDASVYSTKTLLKILKKIYYYSPSSLEAFVCDYCRRKKLLLEGYGPIVNTAVTLPLNALSKECSEDYGNYSPDILCDLYNNNYRMRFTFDKTIDVSPYEPASITLKRGNKILVITGDTDIAIKKE